MNPTTIPLCHAQDHANVASFCQTALAFKSEDDDSTSTALRFLAPGCMSVSLSTPCAILFSLQGVGHVSARSTEWTTLHQVVRLKLRMSPLFLREYCGGD
ncbi:hypothetical protein AC1031_004058 [Aphanomyces cochlioides]|nr:hypothetical protein AC1031_004058 [Aphanomyces cochlioides]